MTAIERRTIVKWLGAAPFVLLAKVEEPALALRDRAMRRLNQARRNNPDFRFGLSGNQVVRQSPCGGEWYVEGGSLTVAPETVQEIS